MRGASINNNYYNHSYNNPNIPNYSIRNFYLTHKIFPKSEISSSEVFWNSLAPRFDYELSMPFIVNQQTAEMLDKGAFIVELWHKSNGEDELLGITKLDLFPIIDSLRINEDTLSIIPISRNLQPIIIYDGNYPVFNYDSFSNIYYLDVTMAVGTTAQVNNYIKKSRNSQRLNMQNSQYNSIYSDNGIKKMMNGNNTNYKNNLNNTNNETLKNPGTFIDYDFYNNNNFNKNIPPNFGQHGSQFPSDYPNNNLNNYKNIQNPNEINDDEIFEINNLMNNDKKAGIGNDIGSISNTNFNKFDVEKFLENNRLELENLNSKDRPSNFSNKKNTKDYSNPFTPGNKDTLRINDNKIDKKDNQYENPFIINTNTNVNNNTNLNLSDLPPNLKYDKDNKLYQISKVSNFYIDSKDKDIGLTTNKENVYKLNKLSDTEFFKSGKNLLKSIENNDINPEFDNYQFKIDDISKNNFDNKSSHNNKESNPNNNLNTESKGDLQDNPFGNYQGKVNPGKNLIPKFNEGGLNNNMEKDLESNNANANLINNLKRDSIDYNLKKSNLIRHSFGITIEKLINLQILNKLLKNRPFLKYKFFNDSDYVKSDVLYYSEYDKETSTVLVDMKTSHSNVLKTNDKIKDLLSDLQILFIYQSNENTKEDNDGNTNNNEVVFGKANLPVEDFQELIFNLNTNNSNNKKLTIFIYGTEKINREDCIIGKLKLSLNYNIQNILQENENENILYEKQIVYSRKIPKCACLIFKFNYFKYNDNFLKNYDCYQQDKNNYFYFEIDIFHDDKNLKNVIFYFFNFIKIKIY